MPLLAAAAVAAGRANENEQSGRQIENEKLKNVFDAGN
jgi:hypothetical protein